MSLDGLQCLVEGAHASHVSKPLCPLGKSCPPIILHGPKLSLECTAGRLVCSFGSLVIRFFKQKTAYEMQPRLVGSEMCIRDSNHLLEKPDDQAAKAAYKTACSTLQAKHRTMQNDWWTGLAERTQRYADMGLLLRGTEGRLWSLTSDPSPSTLFGWKYPADRQGSHSPVLVRAFQGPLQ